MSVAVVRSLNHARQVASERQLILNTYRHAELAALAMAWRNLPDNEGDLLEVTAGGLDHTIRFEDVGGRIDLNTASPILIEAVLRSDDFADDALENYRTWRRTGWRLQRISDLTRIAGLAPEDVDKFAGVTTVFSGRQGIAIADINSATREFLETSVHLSEARLGAWPDALSTPASGVNFDLVFENPSSGGKTPFATVSITEQSRVLALR